MSEEPPRDVLYEPPPPPLDDSSSTTSTRTDNAHLEAGPAPARDASALKSTKSKGSIYPNSPGHFKLVFSHALVTPEVLAWDYEGEGTADEPYIVEFIENDPRNPMHFSQVKKWCLTVIVAIATLAVAFVSSAYTGTTEQIIEEFECSEEVVILGLSLFVLGFAVGPLLWAPFSELYGRQILFIGTYGVLTAFNAAAAGSQNIQTLLILRFFAGAFGSSPLTNAGGVIADIFPGRERGSALALFAAAPFMGPVLGPIVGGFAGEAIGWRWVEGIMAIFTGVLWVIGSFLLPETYAPVILSKRAKNLSKRTGKVYVSRLDTGPHARNTDPKIAFKTALGRPWVLLFKEPIVLLLTIYMAILYGTLYMLFSAFPIVFQENRGWSEGVGGLSFVGVAIGFILAVAYIMWDNKRYERVEDSYLDRGEISAPPEARLPPCIIGCIFLPVGLFWFAWTNSPAIHWSVCIIATIPFGFGMLLVFVSIFNYLIDAYTVYAASVLAANSVLRSLFGMAFPLFTTYMYENLGIHWASSIPAFLALMCVPFPFLFYKYGASIRKRCKYAKEAMEILQQLQHSEGADEAGQIEEHKSRRASRESTRTANRDMTPFATPMEALDEKKLEAAATDKNGEAGTSSANVGGADLSQIATKKSMKSMESARSTNSTTPGRPLRARQSGGHLALDRARSYASNF